MDQSTKPLLIGIPSDTGGGIQRGANWGPLFIREQTHNLHKNVIDIGDVKTIPHLLHDKYLNEETLNHLKKVHYNGEQLPVSPLSIAEFVYQDIYQKNPNAKIIALGGDHSISYPIVKQWILHRRALEKKLL
jgi:agmatinase